MGPADQLLHEYGEQIGVGETSPTPRSASSSTSPASRSPTPTSTARARPHRLHALRPLHGRLPPRGQEHAGEELPLAGREARRRDRRPNAQSPRSARSAPPTAATATRSPASAPAPGSRRGRRTLTARGVIVAAGPLGTNKLLRHCRHSGALPRISNRLGELVRTNSESIHAVTAPEDDRDLTRVAITSSIYPDPDTHIEIVTYGKAGDSMASSFTAMVGDGTKAHPAAEVAGGDPPPPAPHCADAVPQQLVAAHGDPAGDADARQRDAPPPEAQAARRRRAPADRAGPERPDPDLHPGRRAAGRAGWPSAPAGSPRARSRSRCATSRRPPTSSAGP